MEIYSRFFMASSIWLFSKLSRYICVVSRSECPRLSLIMAMFTPDLFKTVANVCRAVWEIIDEASGYRMVS